MRSGRGNGDDKRRYYVVRLEVERPASLITASCEKSLTESGRLTDHSTG